MPGPLLLPLVAAGAQLAGQGINAASTASNNRKARAFQEKMYAMQRADALSDWQMQNAYNSPAQQMARLREAGLNPALIYANGANQPGAVVRSTPAGDWQPKAPQFDLGSVVGQYMDVSQSQKQLDLLEQQKTLLTLESALKAAQTNETIARTENTVQKTEIGKPTLKNSQAISDISLEALRASVNKTYADTQYTLDQNQRAALSNAQSLQEGIARIKNLQITSDLLRAQISNTKSQTEKTRLESILQKITNGTAAETAEAMRQLPYWQIKEITERTESIRNDQKLKQLDINLKKMGIQPGDPIWMRIMAQIADRATK